MEKKVKVKVWSVEGGSYLYNLTPEQEERKKDILTGYLGEFEVSYDEKNKDIDWFIGMAFGFKK